MKIERAEQKDFAGIARLLVEANLPADDLSTASLEYFLVMRDESGVRGAVGLERDGDVALLRSLVVEPDLRGQGLGAALAHSAEALANESGIATLCLLTTSADGFFSSRGYRTIHRDAAPAAIKRSAQYSSLCPSTAVVMVKP